MRAPVAPTYRNRLPSKLGSLISPSSVFEGSCCADNYFPPPNSVLPLSMPFLLLVSVLSEERNWVISASLTEAYKAHLWWGCHQEPSSLCMPFPWMYSLRKDAQCLLHRISIDGIEGLVRTWDVWGGTCVSALPFNAIWYVHFALGIALLSTVLCTMGLVVPNP